MKKKLLLVLVILFTSCAGRSWVSGASSYSGKQQTPFLYSVGVKGVGAHSYLASAWVKVYNASRKHKYTSVTCFYAIGKRRGSVTSSIFLLPLRSSKTVMLDFDLSKCYEGKTVYVRCQDGGALQSRIRRFVVKW